MKLLFTVYLSIETYVVIYSESDLNIMKAGWTNENTNDYPVIFYILVI